MLLRSKVLKRCRHRQESRALVIPAQRIRDTETAIIFGLRSLAITLERIMIFVLPTVIHQPTYLRCFFPFYRHVLVGGVLQMHIMWHGDTGNSILYRILKYQSHRTCIWAVANLWLIDHDRPHMTACIQIRSTSKVLVYHWLSERTSYYS